jgi:hypothetical protein
MNLSSVSRRTAGPPATREQFSACVQAESARFAGIIRTAGAQLD